MSTPLIKSLKPNGSTFYTFPSTSMHPNPNFTKFVLLNIPGRINDKRLDFDNDTLLSSFSIYTEGASSSPYYSEQLIESLRNYVANHDETMRNSRISTTKDFYNIKEKQTPTEIIFWKWLKKMKAIEFEVCQNKVDWDKSLSDFDNMNSDTLSNTDYFRKYLWKERESVPYGIETITPIIDGSVEIIISYAANIKVGDKVIINGSSVGGLITNSEYEVKNVIYTSNIETKVYIIDNNAYSVGSPVGTITLSYNRLVQYIGEINVKSDVKTARKDESEVVAYIPHQAGQTPSVLFSTRVDSNYYPGLELPIMTSQIQPEILGAENLDSPIRKTPGNYPGLHYGQFDTPNKTYQASTGDKYRYSGEYFGINRKTNVGLDGSGYTEKITEFDSSYLDGINIDFDLHHYHKMSLTDLQIGFNFDEFNQITINGVQPKNFEYNAILWYYEVPGDTINDNNIYTNLYGVTFLNNPDNNTDNNTVIKTYQKLVSNDEHDGLSYIHTLNLMTSVDNDTSSMKFDPLTVNNNFGFDLYQNVMTNVAKLNETFINVSNSFLSMNSELNNVKSMVYTQTDMDMIKSKLLNLEKLLKLYQKYQFVDSDTVSIITNYSGTYPTLSFDVKNTEYSSVYNLTSKDIYNYKISNGIGFKVTVPESNTLFIKITNNDIIDYGDLSIVLNKDLLYKQSMEIYVDTKDSWFSNKLTVMMNYYDNAVGYSQNTELVNFNLPNDIGYYISNNVTYNNVYYNNDTISQYVNLVGATGTTTFPYTMLYTSNQNMFGNKLYKEVVYIDNFKFIDVNGVLYDYSGVYKIGQTDSDFNQVYFRIILDTFDKTPVGTPVVYLVKKIKINILRVDDTDTSSISDRYLIQKTFM